MVSVMDFIYSALELISVMGSTCLAHIQSAKKLKDKTSSRIRKTGEGGSCHIIIDPPVIVQYAVATMSLLSGESVFQSLKDYTRLSDLLIFRKSCKTNFDI